MSPPDGGDAGTIVSRRGIRAGMRRAAPIAFTTVFVFGLAFGVAARDIELGLGLAAAMSGLVFAGASQFAVLELWAHPLPILTIALTTAAVNARMLLMGAALRPWFAPLPPWQRYGLLVLLADPVWAQTIRAFREGERDAGLLFGGGLLMWLVWVAGTLIGYTAGGGIGDPARWGVDVLIPAFFSALIVGMWRDSRDLLPWLVAAGTAVAAHMLLPAFWYVVVGGVAGGLAGALRNPEPRHGG